MDNQQYEKTSFIMGASYTDLWKLVKDLKDKLHRRNCQIKDLRTKLQSVTCSHCGGIVGRGVLEPHEQCCKKNPDNC